MPADMCQAVLRSAGILVIDNKISVQDGGELSSAWSSRGTGAACTPCDRHAVGDADEVSAMPMGVFLRGNGKDVVALSSCGQRSVDVPSR